MPNEKDIPAQDGKKSPRDSRTPGAITAKRFFRNRLAVAGLVILGGMFLFSFLGGALSPYGQDQVFYRQQLQSKQIAGISENTGFHFLEAPGQSFGPALQAEFLLAQGKKTDFSHEGIKYTLREEGKDLYLVLTGDTPVCLAARDLLTATGPETFSFEIAYACLKAYTQGATEFIVQDKQFQLEEGALLSDGRQIGYVSRLVVRQTQEALSQELTQQLIRAVLQGQTGFSFPAEAGGERQITLSYDAAGRLWSVRETVHTPVWDAYSPPSAAHPLGTDKNGMDVLTRLMYGGRVSLVIGFVVVLLSGLLGVLLGGVAGYFGGWADSLIMRTVDVFYCIPTTPLLIILGAAMDAMRVDPQVRMLFLMLILGILGWPGIARLVRGQILSLREQEFMIAAEAVGLPVSSRIFRHLIPNVIPQLIVSCTMSLGATILTEATLSFLGLGVKFPFASWGNIMNDVANSHVLTTYWFVWIPAGLCLVLAVLGFNFVGDGLRDALDPKMKR